MVLAALATGALLAGCSAPFEHSKQRMEQLQVARKEARGARIVLRFTRELPVREVAGELIASGPDTVFVLGESGLAAVSSSELQAAEIAVREGPAGAMEPPILEVRQHELGDLVGDLDRRRGRGERWKLLVQHARFPQGLPPGFDRQTSPGP